MAEPVLIVSGQGVAVHGFDGGLFFTSAVALPAPGSEAEHEPVGGPVTGAGEAFGVDKGLQPENRVIIEVLPVC
jgi:hypothetical protein